MDAYKTHCNCIVVARDSTNCNAKSNVLKNDFPYKKIITYSNITSIYKLPGFFAVEWCGFLAPTPIARPSASSSPAPCAAPSGPRTGRGRPSGARASSPSRTSRAPRAQAAAPAPPRCPIFGHPSLTPEETRRYLQTRKLARLWSSFCFVPGNINEFHKLPVNEAFKDRRAAVAIECVSRHF